MSYNILIVDDSSIVRKVLIKTLGIANIPIDKVLEAENGQVALDILADNWVDIIFLDINMPVMNGMEFMENLRKLKEYDNIPIVVISTEGSKERKEELFEKHVKEYLRKPITPEQLSDTIHKLLGGEEL